MRFAAGAPEANTRRIRQGAHGLPCLDGWWSQLAANMAGAYETRRMEA
jgi:hypothetical protein